MNAAIIPVGLSVLVLMALGVCFAACWVMFWALAHRSTEQRHWVALDEWGRERGLRLKRADAEDDDLAPPPLDEARQRLRLRMSLEGKGSILAQLENRAPSAQGPSISPWNVLIRETGATWPATGLRPAAANISLLEHFSLTSFPLLASSERFVLYGTDSRAAAALARAGIGGLLPPDVGLLLHGRHLVLDFSTRPFDTIEFERMFAVADQLPRFLPAPTGSES